MIDHIGMPVGDIARATEFYLKALRPLGYGIVMEVSAAETGHGAAIGFGAPGKEADFQSGKPSFWIGEGMRLSAPIHVAFGAPSREAVDAFYRAGLAAGGKDNGKPGLRPITTPIITPLSCSTPTATISRRCATPQRSSSEAVAHQKAAQVATFLRPPQRASQRRER